MPIAKQHILTEVSCLQSGLQKQLDHLEFTRRDLSFGVFLARFGIQDQGELSPDQLLMFVAARNLLTTIDALQIPQGRSPEGKDAYYQYGITTPLTSIPRALEPFLHTMPRGASEITTVTSPEDIVHCLPEELLLMQLAPAEFRRRLVEEELLRFSWPDSPRADRSLDEEPEPPASVEAAREAAPEGFGSFGYVLLDASESMGSKSDQRRLVGRGAALAFLYTQHMAGNPAVLFAFREHLSAAFGGEGQEAFHSAVAAVLHHRNEGQTAMQGALRELSENLQTRNDRVDIVLISDGLARLTARPCGDAHLHTFFLEIEGDEKVLDSKSYRESAELLKSWSDRFYRIRTQEMREICVPRREDLLSFRSSLRNIREELQAARTSEKAQRIANRIRNVRMLFEHYLSSPSAGNDKELSEMLEMIIEAEAATAAHDPDKSANVRQDGLSPSQIEYAEQIECLELKSTLPEVAVFDQPEKGEISTSSFLWVLMRTLWGRTRELLRKLRAV